MHMNPDVFGLSNTKHLCRNAVLHQGDDVVMMWRTCHFISWWCSELTTSDLIQRSGLFTHVASDLSWARQKYPCTVRGIIGLQHDINVFLSDAAWTICSTYHIVLKASPGAAILGRDMLFDILFIADWKIIGVLHAWVGQKFHPQPYSKAMCIP